MSEETSATLAEEGEETVDTTPVPPVDSKYRLIIVAARRSKQLQRGARPRVDMDPAKHKMTRVAMAEVMQGRVTYTLIEDN
jgi:DNA-directed RNA polymerase omega subunit